MKKKDISATPALTIPLTLLAACVSMWSNNWHMYGWRHLGAALAFLLVLCLVIFLAVRWVYQRHRRGPASRSADLGAGFVICVLMVAALFLILDVPIKAFVFQTGLNAWFAAAAALAVFCLLAYLGGFKTLNFFLVLWLGAAVVSGTFRVATYDGSYKKAVDLRVELKTKPNIYLFYLESYQGLPILEEVFGIDPAPMRTFLDEHGFFIHEPVMSNSPYTLGSMADTFTFQLSPIQPTGVVKDVMPAVRKAIGGSEDNTLFRILKENGYYTVFLAGLKGTTYFFNFKGPYLDDTDANIRSLYIRPFSDLNQYAFEFLDYMPIADEKSVFDGPTLDQVKMAMDLGKKRGQPLFVCFKGGADHTPTHNYIGTPDVFEQWKPQYRKMVTGSDRHTKRIIEYIVAADPDSVIILIGDHGAHAYQDLFTDQLISGDVEGFKRIMAEYGLTQKQVTDSFFNVLLAIRLPGGRPADISHGLPMSHVNLFRHVFAYLNDDPALLKDRAPTRSAFARLVMARDNVPVCERLEEK